MSSPTSWTLGFSTNGFVRQSLNKALVAVEHAGFTTVEILADRPHLFPGVQAKKKAHAVALQVNKLDLSVGGLNCNTVAGYYDDDGWRSCVVLFLNINQYSKCRRVVVGRGGRRRGDVVARRATVGRR